MQPLNRLDVFYFLVRISVGPPGFWFSHRSVSGIVGQWVSLSACNHMCVHTCVSCVCVCVCVVCVFPVLSVRQQDSPLCECVCVQVNYSYTGHRPKAVRRNTAAPSAADPQQHLLTYRNTVLCPNTQDQLTFMLPSNHFRDLF